MLQQLQVDAVIHFAAVAYVGESVADPLRYYQNVTANTYTLLQAAKRAKVARFIYSSSCATYAAILPCRCPTSSLLLLPLSYFRPATPSPSPYPLALPLSSRPPPSSYGNPATMPITEDTPQLPVSPYGQSKLDAEHAVRASQASAPAMGTAILRYFNVIGSDPHGTCVSAVGQVSAGLSWLSPYVPSYHCPYLLCRPTGRGA